MKLSKDLREFIELLNSRGVEYVIAPNRIDLLTGIDGVSFDEAWQTRNRAELDELPVNFLNRESLIKNKLAAGREQDIADAKRLQQLGG